MHHRGLAGLPLHKGFWKGNFQHKSRIFLQKQAWGAGGRGAQAEIGFLFQIHIFPHLLSTKLWWMSERTVSRKQNVLFGVRLLTKKHFLYNKILFSTHLCHRQLKNKLKLNSQERPDTTPNLSSAQMQCWIKPTVIFSEVKEKKETQTTQFTTLTLSTTKAEWPTNLVLYRFSNDNIPHYQSRAYQRIKNHLSVQASV